MKAYIVLKDGSDRPYISTTRPTKERQEQLIADGCELFEVDIEVPGWVWRHGKVWAVAIPLEEE